MFQFSGFAPLRVTSLQLAGLPHSEICGSPRMCQSPQLIAAYHVFHRLQDPRHPPYALCNFLKNYLSKSLQNLYVFYSSILILSFQNVKELYRNSSSLLYCLSYVEEARSQMKILTFRSKNLLFLLVVV
jgi:hypothetical protein